VITFSYTIFFSFALNLQRFTPILDVHQQLRLISNHVVDVMAEFLTAVSTKAVKRSKEPVSVIGVSPTNSQNIDLDSPEEIAKVLKNQPDLESLGKILKHLVAAFDKQHGFNLVTPGPISAQVVDILVTKTIPDYWRTLKDSGRYVKQLIRCLRSANGLGAILSRLRPLITDCRQKKPASNTQDASVHIEDIIDVLEHVLHDDRATSQIWTDMKVHAQNPIQKKLMWKEYVTQVGSGRILSVVAEAEDALKERVSERKASWLGNGKVYASWLGCNMAILIRDDSVSDRDSPVPEFCGKALGLGYLGTYSPRNKHSSTNQI
jgi:telomere length regulation protein